MGVVAVVGWVGTEVEELGAAAVAGLGVARVEGAADLVR